MLLPRLQYIMPIVLVSETLLTVDVKNVYMWVVSMHPLVTEAIYFRSPFLTVQNPPKT